MQRPLDLGPVTGYSIRVKERDQIQMKLTATQNRTRRDPHTGRTVKMVAGNQYTDRSAQYIAWGDTMIINGDTITDDYLLNLVMDASDRGDTLDGNYSDVWYQLVPDIQFCHFRGVQIGRVGRKYQVVTGGDFADLCPDLKNHTNDWHN